MRQLSATNYDLAHDWRVVDDAVCPLFYHEFRDIGMHSVTQRTACFLHASED